MAGASLLVTLLTTTTLVISIDDQSMDSLLLPANSSNIACYQLGFKYERTKRFSDQYTNNVDFTWETIIEEESPEISCSPWKQLGCPLSTHVLTGCIIALCIVCTIAFGSYVCKQKYCHCNYARMLLFFDYT